MKSSLWRCKVGNRAAPRVLLLLFLVSVAILGSATYLVPAPSAHAAGTYGVDDYPDKDAVACGYSDWCKNGSDMSSRGFVYRNCTDFAAWRLGIMWGSLKFPKSTAYPNG